MTLAIIPLLMAIIINIPADAGTVAVEIGPTPTIDLPPPKTEPEPASAQTEGPDYLVILDTGVEVTGYESSISGLAVVAKAPADPMEAQPISE